MKFLARNVGDADRQADVNRADKKAPERIQKSSYRVAVEVTIQCVGVLVFQKSKTR